MKHIYLNMIRILASGVNIASAYLPTQISALRIFDEHFFIRGENPVVPSSPLNHDFAAQTIESQSSQRFRLTAMKASSSSVSSRTLCIIPFLLLWFPLSTLAAATRHAPIKPPFHLSKNIDINQSTCIDSPRWLPIASRPWSASNQGYCHRAINNAITEFETYHPYSPFEIEFHQVGSQATILDSYRTPASWTQNTCVLTIAMLGNLSYGWIPGLEGNGGREVRDTISNLDLQNAAYGLEEDCVSSDEGLLLPGWTYVGAQRSIGLFLWARNSVVDRRVNYPEMLNVTTSIEDAIPARNVSANPPIGSS